MSDQGLLVLIADDYQDTRVIVAEILVEAGYRVEEASDGMEALEKATRLLPDIVLMDLSLPKLDGWEVIKRLRQDERTRRLAIITLTAHALESHIQRARAAGSDAVVTKPCEPGHLLEQIELVARSRRHTKEGT
jgi:two-component system, cell cycle response regulator DivK